MHLHSTFESVGNTTCLEVSLALACHFSGITRTPLFDKTDKLKPLGAAVSVANSLVGQPAERGAGPSLYAAASPDLDGK